MFQPISCFVGPESTVKGTYIGNYRYGISGCASVDGKEGDVINAGYV